MNHLKHLFIAVGSGLLVLIIVGGAQLFSPKANAPNDPLEPIVQIEDSFPASAADKAGPALNLVEEKVEKAAEPDPATEKVQPETRSAAEDPAEAETEAEVIESLPAEIAAIDYSLLNTSLQAYSIANIDNLPLATIPTSFRSTAEVGIGSGAFYAAETNTLYVVTDSGPSKKCTKMAADLQISEATLCPNADLDEIMMVPTIYALRIGPGEQAEITAAIPLQLGFGTSVNNYTNLLRLLKEEKKQIDKAHFFDMEALVRMNDGTFWLADEKAPSLVQVDGNGRILQRLVPPSKQNALKEAHYPVFGTLPAILSYQNNNKGIESLTVSPDQNYLYFTTQAPLSYPNEKSTKNSQTFRIFQYDWQNQTVVNSFLYLSDSQTSYNSKDSVYINDITSFGENQLLILEGNEAHKRIYKIDLLQTTSLENTSLLDANLEAMSLSQLQASAAPMLEKVLVVDTDDWGSLAHRSEGLALIDTQTIALIRDTDYGKQSIQAPITLVVFSDTLYSR